MAIRGETQGTQHGAAESGSQHGFVAEVEGFQTREQVRRRPSPRVNWRTMAADGNASPEVARTPSWRGQRGGSAGRRHRKAPEDRGTLQPAGAPPHSRGTNKMPVIMAPNSGEETLSH
ncbi:hypothetical protein FKM82_031189 [Ascaphus truei]